MQKKKNDFPNSQNVDISFKLNVFMLSKNDFIFKYYTINA